MGGSSRRIVNQIPAARAHAGGKIRIFAAGTVELIVAAGFHHRRLAKNIVGTVEKLRIAQENRTPLLGHAGITPTVGERCSHAFDEDAAGSDDFGVVEMRKKSSD